MRTSGFLAVLLGSIAWIACGSDTGEGSGSPGAGNGGQTGASGSGGSSGSGAVNGGSAGAAGSAGTGTGGGSTGSGGSAGTSGAAGAGGSPVQPGACATEAAGPVRSWCDAATWGGSVPTTTTDVKVSGEVVVDCSAQARSVEIPAGATLRASRSKNSTLTVHGNLVVRGKLDYGTPEARICEATAEIVFQGMKDDAFAGTPTPPPAKEPTEYELEPIDFKLQLVASDYGVWVMDGGVFTAAGRAKRAWSKLTETTEPGDPGFSVEDATGWQTGDKVVITPTAKSSVREHYRQFDEGTIQSVNGNAVTLQAAPAFQHLGCADCMRRGEAANLSRNVIVRSFDDTAHAHMIVADAGLLQLDSVELRWLGPQKPCTRGLPRRRAPVYFFQQNEKSDASFVRHVSIWGGDNRFYVQEKSDGVEVKDVAGYDTIGVGFSLLYESDTCGGAHCIRDGSAPANTVLTDVLAAKVAVPKRDDCNAIGGVVGINPSGGEGAGCSGCVATGVAYNYGQFGNEAAIHSAEGGSGRPANFTLNGCVAHNNAGHGISNWQNETRRQPAYTGNQAWSNNANGIHHGAYGNSYQFANLISVDNGKADFAVIAIQTEADRPRVDGATFDGFETLPYFLVPEVPVLIKNATFTGVRNPAITQVQDQCSGGNEADPEDGTCIKNWLRFESPKIPAGIKPFLFGWHQNKNTVWEIRGFQHSDYPNLPVNFDLYRKDNQVSGGSYNADFDAWLVPR
jgi:hypothetical protein